MTTNTTHDYGFGTALDPPFDEAVGRTKAALKDAGFGVLTAIAVRAMMREKLGATYEPYLILGACNPQLAHQALQAEHELGLLLPCNVIVHAVNGKTPVAIVDPAAMLGVVDNPTLRAVADAAKTRLQRVVAALTAERR